MSSVIRIHQVDPTESKTKRESLRRANNRRWREVRGRNREWIMSRETLDAERIQTDYRRFFENVATKIVLEETNDRNIRRGKHWTGSHIRNAYDTGLRLAGKDMRGLGAPDEYVTPAIRRNRREHQQTLKREYESVYYTVVDHVSYAVSQVTNKLREALENGRSRSWLVGETNQIIRSKVFERYRSASSTSISRVVNEAELTAFEIAGVTEVGVAVENLPGAVAVRQNMVRVNAAGEVTWQTAGDANVCSDCQALEGQTLKISEVRGNPQFQPPIHPNCRCRLVAAEMQIGDETIQAPQDGPALRSEGVNA